MSLPGLRSGVAADLAPWRIAAVAALGLLAACGGSSGSSPTAPVAVATPQPTPIPLQIISAETGAPVVGASVTVSGAEQTTDPDGAFTVPAGTPDEALVDVIAEGYLERQSTLGRANTFRQFALWPLTSPTGLDEPFTRAIVYTSSEGGGAGGEFPLRRWAPDQDQVRVLLGHGFDPSLRKSVDSHNDAVTRINELLGGRPLYLLPEVSGAEPQLGAVLVRIDTDDPGCESDVLALTRRFIFDSGEIARIEVTYCSVEAAERIKIVRHEFGHTIGLQHSFDDSDLMFALDTSTQFTEREELVISLMYQRPAGNRFPDSDRQAGGSLSRTSVETIVCGR